LSALSAALAVGLRPRATRKAITRPMKVLMVDSRVNTGAKKAPLKH
jgi:hypothetical protein